MGSRDADANELWPFRGTVVAETDKAILFQDEDMIDEDDAVWLPKSQIEYWDGEYPDVAPSKIARPGLTVGVPLWLAEAKGLA
jgi:hypothetical protein